MDASLITYLNDRRYPRGIRNNNPGNLVRTDDPWRGKIPFSESKDRKFEQFKYYWYGVRALLKDLKKDYFRDKQNTVRMIIEEYAPKKENKTEQYIQTVCKKLNIESDEVFTFDKVTLFELVIIIGRIENGIDPMITPEIFELAWISAMPK